MNNTAHLVAAYDAAVHRDIVTAQLVELAAELQTNAYNALHMELHRLCGVLGERIRESDLNDFGDKRVRVALYPALAAHELIDLLPEVVDVTEPTPLVDAKPTPAIVIEFRTADAGRLMAYQEEWLTSIAAKLQANLL